MPLVELVLLNQLLQRTSLFTTILVVLLTGVIGISLTRRQGIRAWRAIHEQMAQGRSPSKEILDGVMVLIAGAFLITPGLLTDCVGFSLLVPHIRRLLGRGLTKWFLSRTTATFQVHGWAQASSADNPEDDLESPSVRVVEPTSKLPDSEEK